MRGMVLYCLKGFIQDAYGDGEWDKIVEEAGLENLGKIFAGNYIKEDLLIKVVSSIKKCINMPLRAILDRSEDYWKNKYSIKVFACHFESAVFAMKFLINSAGEISGDSKGPDPAEPTLQRYVWKNDRTLIVFLKSKRGLADLIIGIGKVIGMSYGADFKISHYQRDRLEISF